VVEVQGGTYMRSGGRHSKGAGYGKDARKGNEAQLDGWIHLRFDSKHIADGEALALTLEALAQRRNGGNRDEYHI
jgi:hypothetical protein